MFLIEETEEFLKRVPEPLNWKDFLRVKTIDYKGEEVRTAQSTTWSNLKSALPDEVARVPLESVVKKGSLHYVCNFEEYLLPEAEQVYSRPPRVMVADGEWEPLCRGLLAKGICGLIREEDIYKVKGRPLSNGLFRVPKDEIADGVAVHRLIMNHPAEPDLPATEWRCEHAACMALDAPFCCW